MSKVSKAVFEKSVIRAKDFAPCANAFIDCRTPGSDKKENYSMIGPGVTQTDNQVVNLMEPHGFNIGAAAMPRECKNNLHLHFTAETFYVHKGDWEFHWGNACEYAKVLSAGTVLSPRTWGWRGFRNVSDDDAFLFTVLGKDDTEGIIWHPQVLEEAESHGLKLTADNKVIDTIANPEMVNANVELIDKMTDEQLETLRKPDIDEMMKQVVTWEELKWSDNVLLCNYTDGGKVRMAPVIGWGMTEDREQTPKIYNPHGYSLEWLEIPVGQSVKLHKLDQRQVLKIHRGDVKITLNRPEDDPMSEVVSTKDIVSVPVGSWRTFENAGTETAYVLVVNGEDAPNRITWDDAVMDEAYQNGYALDASGYIALVDLVKYANRMLIRTFKT